MISKANIFVPAFFFLTIIFFINAAGQEEGRCAIRGRVVDETQKPVANAYLHWYPKYGGGLDFISVFSKSDENGNFEYREGCPSGDLTLYVTSSLTFENYAPVLPPFAHNSKPDRKAKGLQIKSVRKDAAELGNVSVQIYYSTVSIRFTDEAGNNLLPEKKDWENVVLSFKDKSGKLFSEEKLTADEIEKAVRIADSTLTVDLPAEDWSVEINLTQSKKNRLKSNELIRVEKNASPKKISLRMIKTK